MLFLLFSFPVFRTNFVREVNPIAECDYKTTNNSDMTLFHDDITSFYDETQFILFQDDTQITLFHLQPEETPDWASSMFFLLFFRIWNYLFLHLETQIQIACINQVYFNDKNPDNIFGSLELNSAREMVQELDLYSSPSLPPNFV